MKLLLVLVRYEHITLMLTGPMVPMMMAPTSADFRYTCWRQHLKQLPKLAPSMYTDCLPVRIAFDAVSLAARPCLCRCQFL